MSSTIQNQNAGSLSLRKLIFWGITQFYRSLCYWRRVNVFKGSFKDCQIHWCHIQKLECSDARWMLALQKKPSEARQIQIENNLRLKVKVKESGDLLQLILEKLVQNQVKFLPSGKMNHGMLQISMKMWWKSLIGPELGIKRYGQLSRTYLHIML